MAAVWPTYVPRVKLLQRLSQRRMSLHLIIDDAEVGITESGFDSVGHGLANSGELNSSLVMSPL